jgi:hypothetical protein
MFLIFRHISHALVTVGDHPDELGDQVVETLGRVRTIDRMILDVRFGGFC